MQPSAVTLVQEPSRHDFAETLRLVKAAITRAGLRIFAEIDHAAGAREFGLEMPPTVVLIYGHPKGGTPLMLVAPAAALDLPLRVLVREADGVTLVAFHPIADLMHNAGIPDPLARSLDGAQRLIIEALG